MKEYSFELLFNDTLLVVSGYYTMDISGYLSEELEIELKDVETANGDSVLDLLNGLDLKGENALDIIEALSMDYINNSK